MPKPPTIPQFIGRETGVHHRKYDALTPKEYGSYGHYYRLGIIHFLPGRDHCFFVGHYIVSRPYPMGQDTMRELLNFAEEYGLEVTFAGQSSWHPATMTIMLWREDWKEAFEKRAARYGDAFEYGVSQAVYYRIFGSIERVYLKGSRRESGLFVINTTLGNNGLGGRRLRVDEVLSVASPYRIGADDYP